LEAETKRQKSSFNRSNACRDQNPGNEWPEIPADDPLKPADAVSDVSRQRPCFLIVQLLLRDQAGGA